MEPDDRWVMRDTQTYLPPPPPDCDEVEYVLALDERGAPRWVSGYDDDDIGVGCALAMVGCLAVLCATVIILVNGW